MEKISKQRIICSISGCSHEAEEDSSPPLCNAHSHEKTASSGSDFGLKAAAEMSEQLWRHNKDVLN